MLKIERDKVYIDGRGQRFRAICVDATTEADGYPVIGINDDGNIRTFTSEGVFQIDHQSERDLVREVKEKQVRYINIYPDGTAFTYTSKQGAGGAASSSRLDRGVHLVRIYPMSKDIALRSAYQLQEALSTMLYRGGLDFNDEMLAAQTKNSVEDCIEIIEKSFPQTQHVDEE